MRSFFAKNFGVLFEHGRDVVYGRLGGGFYRYCCGCGCLGAYVNWGVLGHGVDFEEFGRGCVNIVKGFFFENGFQGMDV
jgi:hypothetical protein